MWHLRDCQLLWGANCSGRDSTIPYSHFVTHHYFVIFNYRPQIYTNHLATLLNTFNIFPYPIPSETKQFHKEMIEIVFSTWHQEKSQTSVTCQHCWYQTLNSPRMLTFVIVTSWDSLLCHGMPPGEASSIYWHRVWVTDPGGTCRCCKWHTQEYHKGCKGIQGKINVVSSPYTWMLNSFYRLHGRLLKIAVVVFICLWRITAPHDRSLTHIHILLSNIRLNINQLLYTYKSI